MANTSFPSRVASEVRAELGRQRHSASWLARELGLSQSRISRRLTGEYPFDLDELEKVAAALNVPISCFLGASGSTTTDGYLADSTAGAFLATAA